MESGKSCSRCQGNGEIVTDWERSLRPHENDKGDEAVAECHDCGGEGVIDVIVWQVDEISKVEAIFAEGNAALALGRAAP